MENLQTRIKGSRQNLGMSQANLAHEVGVSQPTVANWETGSHIPRKQALEKISAALNVDEDWLLSGQQTGQLRSIETYLAKPIQHVPVYAWPNPTHNFTKDHPKDYVPYPSKSSCLFAFSHTTPDTEDRILYIFEKADHISDPHALYLWQSVKGFFLKKSDLKTKAATCAGRLVCKMTAYD